MALLKLPELISNANLLYTPVELQLADMEDATLADRFGFFCKVMTGVLCKNRTTRSWAAICPNTGLNRPGFELTPRSWTANLICTKNGFRKSSGTPTTIGPEKSFDLESFAPDVSSLNLPHKLQFDILPALTTWIFREFNEPK